MHDAGHYSYLGLANGAYKTRAAGRRDQKKIHDINKSLSASDMMRSAMKPLQ